MENRCEDAGPFQGPRQSRGFVLVFSMLMLLGISATGIAMFYNTYMVKVTAQNYKNRVQAFFAADGLITMLAEESLDGRAQLYLDTASTGKITGDLWKNLSGTNVAAVKSVVDGGFPPDKTVTSDYLGSNWDLDNYGVRWRGYVCPPITGSYTFLVRSGDASALYLSQDDQPSNLGKAPIAYLDKAAKQWPTSGTGVSEAVVLQGGKRYYFEYLHKAGSGSDFGQVGWDGPEWINDRPIIGKYLMPYSEKQEEILNQARVGKFPVRYKFTQLVPDIYNAYAEGFRVVGKQDSAYRVSLNQVINMRGRSIAPPDTIWTRVIFYDFHSDGSNPEFEQLSGPKYSQKLMVKPNMLRQELANADYFGLTSIGKPILNPPSAKFNCTVNDWFHEWPRNNFTVPTSQSNCTPKAVPTDTNLKNIVIKDSLPFVHNTKLGPNTYVLDRSGKGGAPEFFPIDDKGFGREGKAHNYSFCMELHTVFQHAAGLTFDFMGDDDVWMFVNDSLVMDIGGIHAPSPYYLELDDLTQLKFGETYSLDFFSCERRTGGSSIKMVTSLPILIPPGPPVLTWKRDYGLLD